MESVENGSLAGSDRLLIILLTLSIVGNIILAILLEKSTAINEVLELRLNHAATISATGMADLASEHPPTMGDVGAPVTLVLFSDFQCPYCREFSATLRKLDPEQKRRTRIVFRQFPLPIHKYARQDAEVTTCTALQSNEAFWALYDYLYTQANPKEDPTDGTMHFLRDRHDINMSDLSTCLRTHQAKNAIEHDISLGKTYGVQGTPTIFVNGKRLSGTQPGLNILLRSMADKQ